MSEQKKAFALLWPETGNTVDAVFNPNDQTVRIFDGENGEIGVYQSATLDWATDLLIAKGVSADDIDWLDYNPTDFAKGQPAGGSLDDIPTSAGGGDGGGSSGDGASGDGGGGDGAGAGDGGSGEGGSGE